MLTLSKAPQTLASILGISGYFMTNGRIVDFELWKICYASIKDYAMCPTNGLDYIALGTRLTKKLYEQSSVHCVGNLASPSICSFVPSIDTGIIRSHFGIEKSIPKPDDLKKLNYYGVRFAEEYWTWVSNIAKAHSIAACANYFCLEDHLLIDLVANASPREILDFCISNPELNKFNLTCYENDCIDLLDLGSELGGKSSNELSIKIAKARKFNHSGNYAKAVK